MSAKVSHGLLKQASRSAFNIVGKLRSHVFSNDDIGVTVSHDAWWMIHAKPVGLNVPRRSLLCTTLGNMLEIRNVIVNCILLLAVLSLFVVIGSYIIIVGSPVTVFIPVDDCYGSEERHSTNKQTLRACLIQIPFTYTTMFFVCHRVNRFLLYKSLATFETLVIVLNYFVARIAYSLSVYSIYRDVLDWEWAAALVVDTFHTLPGYFLLAGLDAWRLHRSSKAMCISVVVVYWAYEGVITQLDESINFSVRGQCIWGIPCARLKSVRITSIINIVVFLLKGMLGYLSGYHFANLRPNFVLSSDTMDAQRSWSRSASSDLEVIPQLSNEGIVSVSSSLADTVNWCHSAQSAEINMIHLLEKVSQLRFERAEALLQSSLGQGESTSKADTFTETIAALQSQVDMLRAELAQWGRRVPEVHVCEGCEEEWDAWV